MSKDKAATVGFGGINKQITDTILGTANIKAVETVVTKRVNTEVGRRADLLEKALDKYNTTVSALKAVKPDNVSYSVVDATTGDNQAIKNVSYSAKAWSEKEKLEKLVASLEVAITRAFSTEPKEIEEGYKKLLELVGNGGKDKQQATE